MISKQYGGKKLGTVMGYRNNFLVSVELRDMNQWRPYARMLGDSPDDEAYKQVWIHCGFCQSTITRVPQGGFPLTIDHDILCRCREAKHILSYFETWMGRSKVKAELRAAWEKEVGEYRITDTRLAGMIWAVRTRMEQDGIKSATLHPELEEVILGRG